MTQYMSSKEFRQRLPAIAEELKRCGEIVVLRRSRPLFKVVPFEESPSYLLDRAATGQDDRPELEEISQLVHQLRET